MRKIIVAALLGITTLIFAIGCEKTECNHIDNDFDLVCDSCAQALPNGNTDNTENDTDSNTGNTYPESDEIDPETGCAHIWLPATCMSDGFCMRCGMEGDKATGHTPGELIVNLKPFCEVEGQYIRPCVVCEEVLEVVEIPALEHVWSDGTCINCGDPQP